MHECGASEGIELVLLVTHHQILFPNFFVVVKKEKNFSTFFFDEREIETQWEIA